MTAVVMLVSFSLAAVESLRVVSCAVDLTGGLSGEVNYFFSCQTEELVLSTQTDDSHTALLQTDLQWDLSAGEMDTTGHDFYPSQFRTSSKTSSLSIKNTILLKLRI